MRWHDGLTTEQTLTLTDLSAPLDDKMAILRSFVGCDGVSGAPMWRFLDAEDFPQQSLPEGIPDVRVDTAGRLRTWVRLGPFTAILWDQTHALVAREGAYLWDVIKVPWATFLPFMFDPEDRDELRMRNRLLVRAVEKTKVAP